MEDKFLKPDYYIGKRKYEPKDVINALNCDFFMGNVLKYLSRAGRKPGSSYEDDMNKAAVYLGFEIDIFDDSKDTNYLPNYLTSNWKFDSWRDVKEDWWQDTDDTLLCRQVFDQLYVFFSSHLEATRISSLKTAKKTIENAFEKTENENAKPNPNEIGVIVDKYVGDKSYIPQKAHPSDAGYDIRTSSEFTIKSKESVSVDTGLHFAIPDGWYGLLESKSGLNANHHIVCLGGTIDSGYTGSVVVTLYNLGSEDYTFKKGDKIVQIVFMPCGNFNLKPVFKFEDTERGDNGFGSSGR